MKMYQLTQGQAVEVERQRKESRNGMAIMPAGIKVYNGSGTSCSNILGHCSCGAYHKGRRFGLYYS